MTHSAAAVPTVNRVDAVVKTEDTWEISRATSEAGVVGQHIAASAFFWETASVEPATMVSDSQVAF